MAEQDKYYAGPAQRYVTGMDPYPLPFDPSSTLAGWERELLAASGNPFANAPSVSTRTLSSTGCGPDCSVCNPSGSKPEPMVTSTCPDCEDLRDRLKATDKAANDARMEVDSLTTTLSKVEAERDEYDREADNLASALKYVTIERDYLLSMVEWHEAELLAAWEKLEGESLAVAA